MTKRRFPFRSCIQSLESRLLLAFDVLGSLADPTSTLSARPENVVHARGGEYTYFDARSDTAFPDCTSCDTAFSGHEIFRTDGTAEGTLSILRRPGRLDSAQAIGNRLIFFSNGTLYSSLGTPESTRELMKTPEGQSQSELFPISRYRRGDQILGKVLGIGRNSDGTVMNVFATDGETVEPIELPFANSQPQMLGIIGGAEAWFLDNGLLWSINRTGIPPLIIRNLRGNAPMLQNIGPAVAIVDGSVDKLFFEAETPPLEGDTPLSGLWRLNAPRRGIFSGITFVAPVTGISDQTIVGDWVYFAAESEEQGRELWRAPVDGTGAELVFDAVAGPPNSHPEFLTEVGGKLLFSAGGTLFLHDPGDADHEPETEVLREFHGSPTSFGPRWLTSWNDLVYFVADDGQGEELWSTDGTTQGTQLVADIAPGPLGSSPNWLTPAGDELHFTAFTVEHGVELWTVDSAGAARLIKDVRQEQYQLGRFVSELTQFNDAIYFRLNDGVHGVELWRSDGTGSGTNVVKDIYPGPIGGSPRDLFVMGEWMYFTANDGQHGYELWRTDGTEAGTSLVIDIWPGTDHGAPTAFTEIDGELWFAANDGTAGNEIWRSDGTAVGTVLSVELAEPSPLGFGSIGEIISVGDRIYVLEGNDVPQRLWQSREGSDPLLVDQVVISPTVINDVLFYVSFDIRKTDGGLPIQVTTVREEQDFQNALAVFNGELYYTEAGGVFKTDGQSDGVPTTLPNRIDGVLAIDAIAASQDHLFGWHLLRANQRATIHSLNKQGEATLLVDDRNKALLNVAADTSGLFFALRNSSGAIEVWYSNGTGQGTRKLDALETTGEPHDFRRAGDHLLFIAEDGQSRESIWSIPLAINGDLNGDFSVTADDVDALFAAIHSGSQAARFDLNDDQNVDQADVQYLLEIAGTRLGDFDLNGQVDFGDFLRLSANFQRTNVGYASGDANGDRNVDFDDFLVLSTRFGLKAPL